MCDISIDTAQDDMKACGVTISDLEKLSSASRRTPDTSFHRTRHTGGHRQLARGVEWRLLDTAVDLWFHGFVKIVTALVCNAHAMVCTVTVTAMQSR